MVFLTEYRLQRKLENLLNMFIKLLFAGSKQNLLCFRNSRCGRTGLKAAARVVNEKSLEMVKVNEINKVTGYVRGCSPIGMKRKYETVVDESCLLLENLIISAGKIDLQLNCRRWI